MTRISAPSFSACRQPLSKDFKPISGLDLLELELRLSRSAVVSCGIPEIDELLGGGFEKGCVVGTSSVGVEGRIISLNLLASIILPYIDVPTLLTRVIVIDTTGHFPLPLLDSILRSRITSSPRNGTNGKFQNTSSSSFTFDIDDQVQRCLQMVGLCRVFDIEGLWEVILEMKKTENGLIYKLGHTQPDFDAQNPRNEEKELEIMDSELELSSLCGSSPASFRSTNQFVASTLQPNTNNKGIEMIIIDNMTTLVSDLLSRREKSEAHDQLELLSQELHIITRQYEVLTFFHNTTVSSKPTLVSRDSSTTIVPKSASIFHSNPLKPALGQIFAQLLTLHLFLSPLPRSRDYSNAFDNIETTHSRKTNVEPFIKHTIIAEVLKDESPTISPGRGVGWRERRWTAVDINENGTTLTCAMPSKPTETKSAKGSSN